MNAAWLRARGLFNRRTARALLWTAVLLAAAVAANVAGIYFIGSIADWEQWLAEASGFFLFWRLCLYGATAYGWRWMRRRLLTRHPDVAARRRLVRTEIAAVLVLVTLESSLLMQSM